MPRQKRNRLVVEPAIQYSLVRQMVAQWTLYLMASAILLTILQVLLGGVFQPWEYHFAKIWPMVASQTIALLFLCPTFILSSFKLSNRFVGPIHRLRKQLRQVALGQPLDEMKFRGHDFWAEVASELEQAIEAAGRAETQAAEAETQLPQSNPKAARGIILPIDDSPKTDSASPVDTV